VQIYYLKADWKTQRTQLKELRHRVFVQEQKVPVEIEQDGQDEYAQHYIALNEAGQLIGCGRLLDSSQIGRLAVLPEHRNRGVGKKLLDLILEDARETGMAGVFLLAQTRANQFYIRAGFVPEGPEFLEAGIPHQKMSLLFPVPFEPDANFRKQQIINPDYRLSSKKKSEMCLFASETTARERLYALMRSASRKMCVYSQQLDHALFDTTECSDLISEFARGGKDRQLHILINDSSSIVKRGHRLQALSQRLSGHFLIRRVQAEYQQSRLSFALADRDGIWVLPDREVYSGFSDVYQPVEAERLQLIFDRCWDHSQWDPELRLLEI